MNTESERIFQVTPKSLQTTCAKTTAAETAQAAATALAQLHDLESQLKVLGEFLETQIDEMPTPQATAGQTDVSDQSITKRNANLQIVFRVKSLLSDGISRGTLQILTALKSEGAVFTAQNPLQRLSQLLSENEEFTNDRATGWSLKGEDPAPTGSSGATKSAGDEP